MVCAEIGREGSRNSRQCSILSLSTAVAPILTNGITGVPALVGQQVVLSWLLRSKQKSGLVKDWKLASVPHPVIIVIARILANASIGGPAFVGQ